jgi:hypothetical protein
MHSKQKSKPYGRNEMTDLIKRDDALAELEGNK